MQREKETMNEDIWHFTIGKLIMQRLQNTSPKRCFCCGTKSDLTNHHVVPKSLGGLDLENNLVKLCSGCHDALHDNPDFEKKKNPTIRYILERLMALRMKRQLDKEFNL